LATDKTTAPFFSDTLSTKRLFAFYDFEDEAKVFRDVHNQMRFAVTTMTGAHRLVKRTRFAFYTRYVADLAARRFGYLRPLLPSIFRCSSPVSWAATHR
jgi:hypothetical protein